MIKSGLSAACAVALAGSAAAVPAYAQTAAPISGPYVAAAVGWDRVDGHDHKNTGFAYGGSVGYDFASGNVRVGPEVELIGSTGKKCAVEKTQRFCSRNGRDIFVGARLGVMATSSALVYITGGYTNAHFDRYVPGDDKAILDKKDRNGGRLGAGVEYALSRSAFLKTEYRYSRYSHGLSRNQILGGFGFRF